MYIYFSGLLKETPLQTAMERKLLHGNRIKVRHIYLVSVIVWRYSYVMTMSFKHTVRRDISGF